MAIEALLERLCVAVEANTQHLQILEAGRAASLEQLKKAAEAGETAPKTRGRKKAADTEGNGATGSSAGADTTSTSGAETEAAPAAAATSSPPTTADGLSEIESELKAETAAYIGAGKDEGEQKARTANIVAIMQHFGGSKLVGPQSTLDDDQKAQALFYVRRFAAGCEVNFSQDYDFSGDPTQDSAGAPADEFDIG